MAKKENKASHPRDFENMSDTEIVSQVIQDLRDSETFQSQYFTIFKECYKLYRSFISDDEKKENRSNLFIPYTFQIIETVVPKLVLAMFSSRPYVQAIPLGVTNNQVRTERSKRMSRLFEWVYTSKIKIIPLITDVLKTMAIYGTAVTKQTWDYETKQVIKKRQKTVLGIPLRGSFENVLVESVTKDHPKIELINILDFFFDPAATSIEDGRYCIHRYYEDFHEIEKKSKMSNGMYINLDKLAKSRNDSYGKSKTDNFMPDAAGISSSPNSNKGIEIHEYWTDDWVLKVANNEVLIYSQPNPFFHKNKPFSKWIYTTLPNEFYGEGAINPTKSLQYELNTTRNQRIDNVSFVLNKMWKILRGANIDISQLVSRPAGFIEVDEMNDIDEIKFNDVTASSYNEESVIKNDMDTASGVFDSARGSSPSRQETATTMSILAKAGSERFQLAVRINETGGFYEMNNQVLRLFQQYIDHDQEVIITGDDGAVEADVISPEDILGEWDIVAMNSSLEPTANKEIRQTQLVQMYGILKDRMDINHPALLKSILEAFDIRNIDEILANPQAAMMQGGLPPELQAMMGGQQQPAPIQSATSFAGGINNG